jgi:hypothetical protein
MNETNGDETVRLDDLLRAEEGDAGCTAGEGILDQYVDLELSGVDPATVFPGTAIHLRSCPGCQADYEGLREAAGGSDEGGGG